MQLNACSKDLVGSSDEKGGELLGSSMTIFLKTL